MAQYAILIYAATDQTDRELSATERAEHDRHAEMLISSGAMVAAFALEDATTATSVRASGMTDGPFVDAKEVIAGFCVVQAPDLDAALELARSNPAVQQGGGVEVRPVEGGFVADRS